MIVWSGDSLCSGLEGGGHPEHGVVVAGLRRVEDLFERRSKKVRTDVQASAARMRCSTRWVEVGGWFSFM